MSVSGGAGQNINIGSTNSELISVGTAGTGSISVGSGVGGSVLLVLL